MANYVIAQLDGIDPVGSPCGAARRAFISRENKVASLHVVDIHAASRVHFHKAITELYFVLQGEGHIELDRERIPLRPYTAVLVKPGCRHRAVGELRVLVVAIPPFDPKDPDEWFDD